MTSIKNTKTIAKFYTARARKIATARARNLKLGQTVRAQRAIARLSAQLAGF